MQSSTFRVNLFIYKFKLDFESQIILSVVSDFCTPLCVCVYRFCTCVCGKQISASGLWRPFRWTHRCFCEEFMSSSESVWKQQFFATLLTDPLHLTHLCKPIIPFSPSLLLHLDQSQIETSNRTVLSYFIFSLLPIPPPAFQKKKKITY